MNSQARLAGGQVARTIPQLGAMVVSTNNRNFVRQMRAAGYIVAPNRVVRNPRGPVYRDAITPSAAGGASNPSFPFQWGLLAVRATEGWVEGRRGAGAVVAVLDEGFYLNHPDLDNNFLVGQAVSFVPGETVQWTLPNGFSHGTHVSGIIAAEDNTIATVGVAPDTKIVPIKVLSEQLGYGLDSWVVAGMLYASEIGVDVVNMSLGGVCDLNDPQTGADCKATKKLYDRVVKLMKLRGVTVIISAGNDAINADANPNLVILPAMANGALAISATGPQGWASRPAADPRRPASYSNYGFKLVDFAAPGGDFSLFGTPEGNAGCTVAGLTRPCWVLDMVLSPAEASSDGTFSYWAAGTSMAAPHVTGIAAQIVGANGGSMAPNQVENRLRRYAEKLQPKSFYGDGFTRAKK
ncbi:MAG: S8 family serine peptidase [Chloroflexi bacterium]|nr:S8 family serine peptidase [Chloroflexota bacterium]